MTREIDPLQDLTEEEKEAINKASEEAETKPSPWKTTGKRVLFGFTFALILALMLSFLLPGTAFHYLAAQFGSSTVGKATITLDTGQRIVFEDNTYQELLGIYHANQRHETKICLEGRKENSDFMVEDITQPLIHSQSFSHVSSEPCGPDTIISLHTHPYKSCFFSYQDTLNLESLKALNQDAFIGLMCEPERFRFYGY